ncbi:hypothetical protein [Legionella sp. CNM-4043-24]|uniref:hypothetical protein n=1 Tax=Legionella sp. CNM-4043-24 TaxID=3421646 RepID=UPI00403B295C
MSTQQNFNALEAPFRDIMNLNVKTIQNFSYMRPMELMDPSKPEQFMDKNVEMLIENGHKALDYMQSMFDIVGKHWGFMSREIIVQSQKKAQKNMREGMIINAKLIEKSTSPLKDRKRHAAASKMQTKPKASPVGKKASAEVKETRQASDKKLVKAAKTSRIIPANKKH